MYLNGTQAAAAVGYSEKIAPETASEDLSKPSIQAEIANHARLRVTHSNVAQAHVI